MAEFPFSFESLRSLSDAPIYASSYTVHDGAAFWLERRGDQKVLRVLAPSSDARLSMFDGEVEPWKDGYVLGRYPTNHANSRALRACLPWLQPVPLGLDTSAGFGDRLGIATPGHVRALVASLQRTTRKIVPIFAQQSIREMARTRRSPEDVMSDATWGTFQAGWRGPVGADADHLKTTEDIDRCAAVGFTLYTIDPGDHVDSQADTADASLLAEKVEALPWDALESSVADLKARYVGQTIDLGTQQLTLGEEEILRAAAKYGRAVAHVVKMARHLEAKGIPYELEVSVDETETPTTLAEHVYVASELKRLGVRWVSLAPRYIGRFEKGIDYIGDLEELAQSLAGHAAIAKALGPYKLSIHSGSDKFSVYPLIHEATGGLVHLKTAGTSYVEALRVIARVDPALFRRIGDFARERYPVDKASYHVSADLSRVPPFAEAPEDRLEALIDDRDARQVLHVTFGSVLDEFGDVLMGTLEAHEEEYYAVLQAHFERHLAPFLR